MTEHDPGHFDHDDYVEPVELPAAEPAAEPDLVLGEWDDPQIEPELGAWLDEPFEEDAGEASDAALADALVAGDDPGLDALIEHVLDRLQP